MDTSPAAPHNVPTSPESARYDTQRILSQSESMLNEARRNMLDKAIETVRLANDTVMRHVEVGVGDRETEIDMSQARSAFRLAARAFLSIEQNGVMRIINEIGKDLGVDVSLYKRGRMAAKEAIKELAEDINDTGGTLDGFPKDWDEETIALFKSLAYGYENNMAYLEHDMLDKAIEIARFANNEVMRHVEVGQNDPSQARSAFRLAARAFLSIEQNGVVRIISEISKYLIGKDFDYSVEVAEDVSLYKRGRMAAKIAITELAFQLYDTGVSSDFPEDWNKETIALFKELVF